MRNAPVKGGSINAATIDVLFEEAAISKKKEVTLEQFSEFVRLLEETLEAIGEDGEGEFLLIYISNFHVLSHLLLIYICKLHWNPSPPPHCC